ncbi:MAG TPA: cytochrome c [Rhodanobacteraceae bacterium]|jgi:mono/diheme cytochrome c family protein|nr:cytochrome c [Rhodanobacteraceae bacterium]
MNAHYWVKRVGFAFAVIAVIGFIVLGWYATRPGPLAFAAGKTVALAAFSGHPTGVPADFSEKDNVARGRYLAQAADCEACHTANEGKLFAGGVAFKTPFGTLYSPNITPDKETGIGAWSDAEFLKAVHEGVAADGERLYPAFPYAAYTYLTDEDVLAIKAYLFSLAPVKNAPPVADLRFPYNQRWLMAFWSGLFNPKQRFQPVADRSPEWNRGAYLAEALAHCGDCHTPRNLLQALDNNKKFGGAVADGWRAYNITSDSSAGVGSWTEADLAQYLSTGHARGRGTASGPMAQAVDLSFDKLTPSDIRAIVTYLRSIPAVTVSDLPASRIEAAPANPKQGVVAEIDPRGKQVFEGACASCHAWTGDSPLDSRAALTGSRAVNDPTAVNVVQMVLSGSRWQPAGSTLAMPAFGAAYSDREIAAVANYVTARFGKKSSSLTAEDVRKLRSTE